MQTRAGRRRAAEHATALPPALPPPGWPLLHLPAPAQHIAVADLARWDRRQLRLACKATKQLVDEATTSLQLDLCTLTQDALSSIRARFPSLTKLTLDGGYYNSNQGEVPAAAAQAAAWLAGPQPWPAITCLVGRFLPGEAVAQLAQQCHNLQKLSASCLHVPLGEQAMCALARCCPSLTSLHLLAALPTAAGLVALLSMTGLVSLELVYDFAAAGRPALAWDLRSMCALQKLSVTCSEDAEWERDEEGYTEEQARLRALELPTYAVMQLPASLRTLQLDQLPSPALALPVLRVLKLERCTLTDALMGKLAGSCLSLVQLAVESLSITLLAHAAPLKALARLHVAWHMRAAAGVRLGAVFPALASCIQEGACVLEQPELFFAGGPSSLRHYDGSCGMAENYFYPGISMPVSMFGPMPALRRLQRLHLNAEPAHVEGVQILTQLTSIEWLVDAQRHDIFVELQAAFATFNAPARLQDVLVTFPNDTVPMPVPQGVHKAPIIGVADAMVSWLVRAAQLRRVEWNNERQGAGTFTDIQLGALVMSSSIRHISIDSDSSYDPLSESLLNMARLVSSRRQVHVEVQRIAY